MAKMTKEQKNKMEVRKGYYSNDVLQINSKVVKAKNSNLPFLNNKGLFLYNRLLQNDISKNFTYTLDSLTNDYRKEVEKKAVDNAKNKDKYNFRKSFKTSEVIDISTVKSVIQYIYVANNRLFEYYRNSKGNYLLREVDFISNLTELKDRKEK